MWAQCLRDALAGQPPALLWDTGCDSLGDDDTQIPLWAAGIITAFTVCLGCFSFGALACGVSLRHPCAERNRCLAQFLRPPAAASAGAPQPCGGAELSVTELKMPEAAPYAGGAAPPN